MAAAGSDGGPYRNREVRAALVPPPRRVPGRLVLRLLGGGTIAPIGWFVMTIGSIVLWAMAGHIDYQVDGPYRRHEGEVVGVHRTSISENKRAVHRVEFTFVDDDTGEERRGASYTDDDVPAAGETVRVDVPRGQPSEAVIHGMRRRELSRVALVIVVLPLVGLGLVLVRVVRGLRDLRLLARGHVGAGKLVHQRQTNMEVNHKPVIELSFDFEAHDGRTHRAKARVLDVGKLTDESLEPLVYDPARPSRAAMLDALPGGPRVSAEGKLTFDDSPWGLLSAVGLPLLFVLVQIVASAIAALP
jgi:hypothetical protein